MSRDLPISSETPTTTSFEVVSDEALELGMLPEDPAAGRAGFDPESAASFELRVPVEGAPERLLPETLSTELADPTRPFSPPPPGTTSPLPVVGESLGGFRLLSVLGRGVRGSVFLAVQPSLANRPVVLKITPRKGREHLCLARLQHAHILPLYWAQDLVDRNLRVLCMPYLGGATLAELLSRLKEIPRERRTGRDLLEALDALRAEAPVELPVQGPARQFLARATYIQAICWIGACLADALDFAHRRNLLHLDIKPSNVLLAADGTPMLLDFHLAQAPIHPDGPPMRRLGGTPAYMSPEQWAALEEARSNPRPVIQIDGRSDVYALGRLLYKALGGTIPAGWRIPFLPRLELPPQVPPGLRDILGRCLRTDPRDRYPDAAALAGDLRRHLADLPLRGVANRSWAERWRKWRRRHPHALGRVVTVLLGSAAVLLAVGILGNDAHQHLRRAEAALSEGRRSRQENNSPAAVASLERGLNLAAAPQVRMIGRLLPWLGPGALRESLDAELRLARRAESAAALHGLADRTRLLSGTEIGQPASEALQALQRRLRITWEARGQILAQLGSDLAPDDLQRLRADLLELGIFGARLRVRLAAPGDVDRQRHAALLVLDQAETQFGPRAVLERERQSYAESLGLSDRARAAAERLAALTASAALDSPWEHYALGRSLLDAGDPEAAAQQFAAASELRPQELWPHFSQGLCAYRLGRFDAAVAAFDICIALAPNTAECFYNRARSHAALGQTGPALRDYNHALRLDPDLAAAALNRGALLFREKRYPEAIADFRRALAGQANPATAHYNLALAYLAQGDRSAARESLMSALLLAPEEEDFRKLQRHLQDDSPVPVAPPPPP
jgi:serine/threonine protein kinase/tetratricopeptide (TPR) repeat protein